MKLKKLANSRLFRQLFAAAGLAFLVPVGASLYYASSLADAYSVRQGETLHIAAALPITAVSTGETVSTAYTGASHDAAALRLFGIFPIKTVEVAPAEEVMLIPGGEPFGVRMLMDGCMVIGFGEVSGQDGGSCPGQEAGLIEGDIIREADHVPVTSSGDLREAASAGETMLLTVCRDGKTLEVKLTPVWSVTDAAWQTGLWVRDSAAGIGTLTFYDPEDGSFAGLGHPICDPDTGCRIPLGSGEADSVTISGSIRGRPGTPGQLQGYFSADAPLGTLTDNTSCGIFGTADALPETAAIPMALKQEVTLGDALILTTVSGGEPEPYTAKITAIDCRDETRNMIVEITDERLLAETGGIVQGMSGSPILQNGRLVGAVTHVFVSDPTRGYGIFAETMVRARTGQVRAGF
ncbi:MAG: SpoIVB peptidase [Oscillospiraceae bacterium]|nr:SpoIVB peptidase [Oscillospiraceae bacterium]